MKKLKGYAAMTLASLSLISGCSVRSDDYSQMMQEQEQRDADISKEISVMSGDLNERQKQILEKEGLPTEYAELSDKQINGIQKIEASLQYMEAKYPDDSFAYQEFYMKDIYTNESEYTVVTSKNGGDKLFCVYVSMTTDGFECSDDYMPVMESDLYAEAIEKMILNNHPNAEIKITSTINPSTYIQGDGDILSRASGRTKVVMTDVFEGEDNAKSELTNILNDLNERRPGTPKAINLIVLNNEDFQAATLQNVVDDYCRTNKNLYEVTCSTNSSGTVRFIER